MPPLLHLPDGVAFTVFNEDGAVDEVEGPPHLEDDLAACNQLDAVTPSIWIVSVKRMLYECVWWHQSYRMQQSIASICCAGVLAQ